MIVPEVDEGKRHSWHSGLARHEFVESYLASNFLAGAQQMSTD